MNFKSKIEKIRQGAENFIYDLPSKARTGTGMAILGPLSLYITEKIVTNPQIYSILERSNNENVYLASLIPLILLSGYMGDRVGSVVLSYGVAISKSTVEMLSALKNILLRQKNENIIENIRAYFREARLTLEKEWDDIRAGSIDDSFGSLVSVLLLYTTGYLNNIKQTSVPYQSLAFFGIGTVSDIIGDLSREILYFSLYYGLRFVNWLKKQSKFEKLQKKKSIETPTPVEIISEKQDISSEKQDISSIIEGIKSKTITLRDIDWKSLSPEERHEIVKSLRNK